MHNDQLNVFTRKMAGKSPLSVLVLSLSLLLVTSGCDDEEGGDEGGGEIRAGEMIGGGWWKSTFGHNTTPHHTTQHTITTRQPYP